MTTTTDAPARALLLHGPAFDLAPLRDALEEERVAVRKIDALAEIVPPGVREAPGEAWSPDSPAVLILDEGLLATLRDAESALDALSPAVVAVARGEAAEGALDGHERLFLTIPDDANPRATLRLLQPAFRHAAARLAAARTEAELARTRGQLDRSRNDLEELNQIGMALMTERDPDRLLDKILSRAMAMTRSDAGSLYLVEHGPDGAPDHLRFKLSRNESLPELRAVEFTLPLDRSSIAGYVATTNEPLVLDDVYAIPASRPYAFNAGFDEQYGYRARSMVTVPMADQRGVVVGVIQLINRKRDPDAAIMGEAAADEYVLPYREHELSLLRGLAGQAAVSIENTRLTRQVQDLFESFVKAAVAAIDQRDPTTAGHSVRVSALTTAIAERLPRLERGRWAATTLTRDQMKELRYAALLHDFGKVGVREEVLVKARKLPPHLRERLEGRFDFIHRTLEKEFLEKKVKLLRRDGYDRAAPRLSELDAELRARLRQLRRYREAVARADEPSILPEAAADVLDEIAGRTFQRLDGATAPYLEPAEFAFLTIPKGTLDASERREIESHVTQTYRFLTQIPWTDDLRHVAEIAYGHHEKLDGRGYPRGIAGEEIPVQTRIMTIADIFDALTASDRPYKRALPADRALDILRSEAADGMLDGDLVELMVGTGAYRRILETDWREL